VFAKARRLDPDKLRKAEAEFRELEAEGIIRRSDSPWSSLLHMVRKKDGSWRPCGDYRRLNLAMTHDRYGTVNFYRRFLPGIARTLQLLTDALKGAPKTLEWPPAAAAFGAAKASLAAAVPLAHPAPNAVLSLATDASDTHVCGVLQQLNGGRWQPLAFYSKKLSGAGNQVLHLRQGAAGRFQRGQTFQVLTGRATVPPTD
jgi:hypothetical protein